MRLYHVFDAEFKQYGAILEGYDLGQLLAAMKTIPLPANRASYEPSIASLEACDVFIDLRDRAYGGMPIELGMCWGYNTKLNCLEYHRDSEINIGTHDFILFLAKRDEIIDGALETSKVKAFYVPAGTVIEIYATSLHYTPCQTDNITGFRVAVVLPKGTNAAKPEISSRNAEDKLLVACNKWLLAHADTDEARNGAYIGLLGNNVCIDCRPGANQFSYDGGLDFPSLQRGI